MILIFFSNEIGFNLLLLIIVSYHLLAHCLWHHRWRNPHGVHHAECLMYLLRLFHLSLVNPKLPRTEQNYEYNLNRNYQILYQDIFLLRNFLRFVKFNTRTKITRLRTYLTNLNLNLNFHPYHQPNFYSQQRITSALELKNCSAQVQPIPLPPPTITTTACLTFILSALFQSLTEKILKSTIIKYNQTLSKVQLESFTLNRLHWSFRIILFIGLVLVYSFRYINDSYTT